MSEPSKATGRGRGAPIWQHPRDGFPSTQDRPGSDGLVEIHSTVHSVRSLDMHVHRAMEVGINLEGAEEVRFDGLTRECRPGDVWLCAMWEPHGWRVTVPRTKNVVLCFLPEFVGEELGRTVSWLGLFTAPPGRRPRSDSRQTRELALAIGRELERETRERRPGWTDMVRAGLVRLLVALTRDCSGGAAGGGRSLPDPNPNGLARITPALELVQSKPFRRVRSAEAASACGLSVSRFQHVFREVMGVSFARFRLRSVLAFCAHRLLTTDLPIQAIADEAGFVDDSHLHHAFLKRYRCTPTDFRRGGGAT